VRARWPRQPRSRSGIHPAMPPARPGETGRPGAGRAWP
jgi:hypothetical protein